MRLHRFQFFIPLVSGLVLAVCAGMVLSIQYHQGTAVPETEGHEPLVYHGVTASGVERWSVKTGTDARAQSVNTKTVVNTTIFHLQYYRHLPRCHSTPG